MAKGMIDKWCRRLFDEDVNYDAEGNFDRKYKEYRSINQNEYEHPQPIKRMSSGKDIEEELTKLENEKEEGMKWNANPNFDFVYRPKAAGRTMEEQKQIQTMKVAESLKTNLAKKINQLKDLKGKGGIVKMTIEGRGAYY
jgi:hypothetical protein